MTGEVRGRTGVSPIFMGSFALHCYMRDCGLKPQWIYDDVDVAVQATVYRWHPSESEIRSEIAYYVGLFPGAVKNVSISFDDLRTHPRLMGLVDTKETRAIRSAIEDMRTDTAGERSARLPEEAFVRLRDATDETVKMLERALASYEGFARLKEDAKDSVHPDPRVNAVYSVLRGATEWSEHFHEAVRWVVSYELDGMKYQVVGISPTLKDGWTLSGTLRRCTDQPASVQAELIKRVGAEHWEFRYDVSERTEEVVRTGRASAKEICKNRRAKYEARGFAFEGEQ